MTDLDTLRDMLTRAGLKFEEETCEYEYDPDDTRYGSHEHDVIIAIVRQDDERSHGYDGFYTEFVFKPDGSLRTVGAWE